MKQDVAVFCSGFHGGFSLEDAVCGGTIVASLGFDRDLAFAARMNSLPVVPVYREGRIAPVKF